MHFKSIFISDIHLGTPQCQIKYLLNFFHNHIFDNIYLVGDIIDIEYIKRNDWSYWSKDCNTFIQKILRMARKGANVYYISGNHDAVIRNLINQYQEDFHLGNIQFVNSIDIFINKKKILVIHGDQFDGAFLSFPFLYWIGDKAYSLALKVNTIFNFLRRKLGLSYWSLSSFLKQKVKSTMNFIANIKKIIFEYLNNNNYDGIIYGHTHTPDIEMVNYKNKKFVVVNDGDCVESLTCVVETFTGNKLQLIYLPEEKIIKEISLNE